MRFLFLFRFVVFYMLFFQIASGILLAQNQIPKPKITLSPDDVKIKRQDSESDLKTRLEKIREKDIKVENKVVNELNKKRFNTLSRKWWNMPTESAQVKINEGRYKRYRAPEGIKTMLNEPGRLHRHNKEILNEQNVVVWGWHPYWSENAYTEYNFKLLTHIGFYAYELNPFTGGYKNFQAIHDFRNSDLITMAHKDSCKVLLTLSCHRPECSEIFFTGTSKVRMNLIDSLLSVLNSANGDGVEINFEEIPFEFKTDFQDFVKELSFRLRENNPNYSIAMTLPLYDNEKVYDLGFLQNWVDIFIISGFNFHLRQVGVTKGAIAPMFNEDASVRGSYMAFAQMTNLDSVLRSPGTIRSIEIMQNETYMNRLLDTLNNYVKRSKIKVEDYNQYDFGDVLRVIRDNDELKDNPNIRQSLKGTVCKVEMTKRYNADERIDFFLFSPEWDTVPVYEFDVFNGLGGILSKTDSVVDDLVKAVERYTIAIGKKHASSLVLGLPYYGAVWRKNKSEFLGYITYAQIRNLIRNGSASVRYDKRQHTMIATVSDSTGPFLEIFFDNSTSLALKIDMALEKKLGGVAVWALSYDHGYTELWNTLEQHIAAKKVWNPKTERFEQFKINKGNKIHYSVAYQMKRNSNLIFASLVFVTVFISIAFVFTLLDWRIRDVMFYSGAFRIFYLTIFTVFVLVVGNWLGLFQNLMAAFMVGIIMGGILTWLATILVKKRREKLP
jgi:spore germination protein YaaH